MTNEMSPFIWYELMTQDLEQGMDFYSKVVGWQINDSGHPGMPYMLFGRGGTMVGGMMSWSSMGMTKPTSWKGHILTRDVDAEAAAVVADGGKLHRPVQQIPEVGRFAVVSDPQGAEYLLFEPNQQQAPPQLGAMEVGAVGWRELMTTDWEKAWEFYSKHYGWTKLQALDMGPAGTYQLIQQSEQSGGGMMTLPEPFKNLYPEPMWLFYFTVDGMEAAAERIRASGGRITHGPRQVPGGTWILQAVDSQGGAFGLSSEAP